MIDRHSFVPVASWESHAKDLFPNARQVGNSIVITYTSPNQSEEMLELVKESGLELIKYDKTNSQMIIDAMEKGIDKIYNCNTDVALEVCAHFEPPEPTE